MEERGLWLEVSRIALICWEGGAGRTLVLSHVGVRTASRLAGGLAGSQDTRRYALAGSLQAVWRRPGCARGYLMYYDHGRVVVQRLVMGWPMRQLTKIAVVVQAG